MNDFWPHRLARPRTSDFHSANRGSNPLGVNLKETLAQSVEHLTFNERVDGSNPSSLKSFFLARNSEDIGRRDQLLIG